MMIFYDRRENGPMECGRKAVMVFVLIEKYGLFSRVLENFTRQMVFSARIQNSGIAVRGIYARLKFSWPPKCILSQVFFEVSGQKFFVGKFFFQRILKFVTVSWLCYP